MKHNLQLLPKDEIIRLMCKKQNYKLIQIILFKNNVPNDIYNYLLTFLACEPICTLNYRNFCYFCRRKKQGNLVKVF